MTGLSPRLGQYKKNCFSVVLNHCIFCCISETVAVPVHVVMNPAIAQSDELDFVSQLTRTNEIINVLMETSTGVIRLKKRLRKNITRRKRRRCEDDLREKFELALYQGDILPRLVCTFAQMFARNTVRDIEFGSAMATASIVVCFLCKTDEALCELSQMITSGFLRAVFAAAIESLVHRPTTVDFYVRADELKLTPLHLSSLQDKGKLGDI